MPTPTEIGWAADATRFRLGLGAGQVDPCDAIRRTGAYLLRLPLGTKEESIDGAFMRKDGRRFVLLNTQTFSLARQRFSAAHELGHLVLHGDRDQLILDVDVDLEYGPELATTEKEADAFAAAFLMDEASVREAVKGWATAEEMAITVRSRFMVSLPAAARRLVDLGLATEDDKVAVLRHRKATLRARHEAVGVPWFDDKIGRQSDVDPKLGALVDDLFGRGLITGSDRRRLTTLT